jgi:pimeloyl-ACP methyl ester carboxylesterase
VRVKFVDVDGIRTRYLHEGTGYPVFLFHGLGVSADTWNRNIDPLAQNFRVYAPDFVGHGFTEPVDLDGEPPQPHIVGHLKKLVDQIGIQRFSVVGSSFGGLVAGLLYFEMPERVDKIVFIGSGSAFQSDDEVESTYKAAYENATRAILNPTLESCRNRLATICYDPSAVPEEILPIQLTTYALPGMARAYEQTMRGLMNTSKSRSYRIADRLDQIKIPTLVMWGRQDIRAPYIQGVEAQRKIPNAELFLFENCGHLPYIEQPDLFNQVLREFLQR